jgi:type II secretory pathway pseudopilin PulG
MNTSLTLIGAGLAVVGGLLSGALTNWLGAKRDERKYRHEQALAREAQRHEQALAREARRQERLALRISNC